MRGRILSRYWHVLVSKENKMADKIAKESKTVNGIILAFSFIHKTQM